MTVRQLLSSIDSRELMEWVAFFNLKKEIPTEKQDVKKLSLDEQFRIAFENKRKEK